MAERDYKREYQKAKACGYKKIGADITIYLNVLPKKQRTNRFLKILL